MLPVHTAKAHGVDKWALRDLAHLTSSDPLCSQEARDKMRDAYDPERGVAAREASRRHHEAGTHASTKQRTKAGREAHVEALRAYMEGSPDAYRESLARAHRNSVRVRTSRASSRPSLDTP